MSSAISRGVLELKNSRVSIGEGIRQKHFTALMDAHMAQWRLYRDVLNTLPLAHQDREY